MLHSLSEWSFWVLLESDGEVTVFTVNTYDFEFFLNFFEFSTVSFINSIESLKMFFSEYEHKELEQALGIDIHTQYFILF